MVVIDWSQSNTAPNEISLPLERVRNSIFAWLHRRGDLSEIFCSECPLKNRGYLMHIAQSWGKCNRV